MPGGPIIGQAAGMISLNIELAAKKLAGTSELVNRLKQIPMVFTKLAAQKADSTDSEEPLTNWKTQGA